MTEVVAVFAVLGALIEYVAVVAGPQLATVGTGSDTPIPGMDAVSLAIAVVAATLSVVGAVAVMAGRDARRWGLVLIASAVAGSLAAAPSTGFYAFGAVFVVAAGVMALLAGLRRGAPPA